MGENSKNCGILQLQIFNYGELIVKIPGNRCDECDVKIPLDNSNESKKTPDYNIDSQEQDNSSIGDTTDTSKTVRLRWEVRKAFMQSPHLFYERLVGLLKKNQVYNILENIYGADSVEEKIRTCLTQLTYDGELTRADQSPDTPWIRTKKMDENFATQGKRLRNSISKSSATDSI